MVGLKNDEDLDADRVMDNVQQKFDCYRDKFMSMTKKIKVSTTLDIESIIITYDSKYAITVHLQND